MSRRKNLIKIKKNIIKNEKSLIEPNVCKLIVNKSNISLIATGKIFAIEIYYKGNIRITSDGIPFYRIKQFKNKILVLNHRNYNFPEGLFSYNGFIEVTKCEILTFKSRRILASIVNQSVNMPMQIIETKIEDEDIKIKERTILDETPYISRTYNNRLIKRNLLSNSLTDDNFFVKMDRRNFQTIESRVNRKRYSPFKKKSLNKINKVRKIGGKY